MRKLLILPLVLLCLQSTQGQTWDEWFKQKKTQIEYLVKQIARLQVYIEQARKGYEIAEKGLTTIGNIKNGDVTLHRDFFAAFSSVNPKIRGSAQVADMICWQINMIKQQRQNQSKATGSDVLNKKEINYITGVYRRLAEQTVNNIEELTVLLTANQYVLSDDERMRRINFLHQEMQDQYGFIRWFGSQTDILVLSRTKERQDASIGRQLFGE